jgi:hypothetical protein
VARNYIRERDQIIHKYNGESQWTLCGRYSDTLEGLMNVIASDKAHEVSCKRCKSIMENHHE